MDYQSGGYYHDFDLVDDGEIATEMQRLLNEWHACLGQLIGEFSEKYDQQSIQDAESKCESPTPFTGPECTIPIPSSAPLERITPGCPSPGSVTSSTIPSGQDALARGGAITTVGCP